MIALAAPPRSDEYGKAAGRWQTKLDAGCAPPESGFVSKRNALSKRHGTFHGWKETKTSS